MVALLTEAAEQHSGDPKPLCARLGIRARPGCEQSDDQAFAWYIKAAQQGRCSQYNLGRAYECQGASSRTICIRVVQKAAAGNAHSQTTSGWHTITAGGASSRTIGHSWYSKAAQQGS